MSERHDWLNLIEVSGPFLSIPVLDEVFPQGLEGRDKRDAARIRQAYDEWREAVDVDDPSLDELHRAWVDEVLATALQMGDRDLRRGDQVGGALHVSQPEHGVTLTPDIVLVNVNDTDKPLLPMFVQPPNAPLDEVVHRDGWAASPAERMVHYLRGVDCPIGLVTNGERWMLVHAPAGQVTSFVSWYARLWSQEPETLRAFVSLLAVPRFYGPEEGQLPSLFAKSEKHQDEVTEALGDQVRTAIEVLIQAIDKANQDRNGKLLEGVTPQELYEGGLTVMMRLVFILSAEERGLLLLGNNTYDNHYALSTFRQRLRRVSSNAHELLERRHAGWSRLLALFRAIYGGIEHSDLRLPAMGGSLFDPDRYPFLEGRAKGSSWLSDAADPLPIDDRTVLLMLDAIQSFEGRTLSYRALDVEQIGHVYEGLLERTVRQIDEVTLELRGSSKIKSPKVTLRELAEAGLDGQETLLELLEERTGRSVSALRNDLQRSRDDRLSAVLLTACRGGVKLHDRVEPYVHLMALDPWDHPRLYHPGAYAVVMGSDRRETGTHYTPKSLTEKIVHETLPPITYVGPAEGRPKKEWQLKSPAELLDLKVCDPAMGSGAFLVQACRWLGDRLVEAWSQAEASGGVVGVDGEMLKSADESELLPRDAEERTVIARRLVAERCLYGVDMNPLAVELAKLSIWLVTLAEGRPFGFLDHNLRCGDSLLGIHRLDQLTELSMRPTGKGQQRLFGQDIKRVVQEATELRQCLRAMPIRDIRDVEVMAQLDTEARKKLDVLERIADAFIGAAFVSGSNSVSMEREVASLAVQAGQSINNEEMALRSIVKRGRDSLCVDLPIGKPLRKPFHWPLEFPEVFGRKNSGFDALVGNPPFMGGRKISTSLGVLYLNYLTAIRDEINGVADLVCHFFRQCFDMQREGGVLGLVATKSISEVDSRRGSLGYIVKNGGTIYCAVSSQPWPGKASVVVSLVHVFHGSYERKVLNGEEVSSIQPSLVAAETPLDDPKRLRQNIGLGRSGSKIMGDGFKLTREEGEKLLSLDPSAETLIRELLSGSDITGSVNQSPTRLVIDPGQREEEDMRKYPLVYGRLRDMVLPSRSKIKDVAKKKYWWRYAGPSAALYKAIRDLSECIVCSRVSKHVVFQMVPTFSDFGPIVFDESVVVMAWDDYFHFAALQSSLHSSWVGQWGSKMGSTQRYTPTEVMETFPFPPKDYDEGLENLGSVYFKERQRILNSRCVGLTDFYNSFHDDENSDEDVVCLRKLQVELDSFLVGLYGWSDLDLGHGFHDVPDLPENDRIRFTISNHARIEVLRRLFELNHQRYEEEVSQGLHEKGSTKTSTSTLRAEHTAKVNAAQPQLDFESGNDVATRGEVPTTAILKFLKSHDGWYAKADILAATGITDSHWTPTIRELINRGLVERQGERRGARYRAVRNDS